MRALPIANPFTAPVLFIPRTPSTMAEARKYVRSRRGEVDNGTVVLTNFQSEGRGRLQGRRWISPPGKSILATTILRRASLQHTQYVQTSSIRVARAVSHFLEKRFSLDGKIKWPNDVLVEGKKISGILCELAGDFLYIGIGLNCRQEQFDGELASFVTSLQKLTGLVIDRKEELSYLMEEIKDSFEYPGIGDIESKLYRMGERVRIVEGNPDRGTVVEGVVEGMDKDGALLLRSQEEGTLYRILSGEFSLRES